MKLINNDIEAFAQVSPDSFLVIDDQLNMLRYNEVFEEQFMRTNANTLNVLDIVEKDSREYIQSTLIQIEEFCYLEKVPCITSDLDILRTSWRVTYNAEKKESYILISNLLSIDKLDNENQRLRILVQEGKAFQNQLKFRLEQKQSSVMEVKQELVRSQLASLNIMEDLEIQKKEIDKSLKEKEVLLKEIHHRVKNNLQVIYSLLKLQSKYILDEDLLNIFKESQNRVRSMALIHERLYQSDDLSSIHLKEYIKTLVNNLIQTYHVNRGIVVEIDAPKVSLGIDTMVPLGLLINEVASNSMKYAFDEDEEGRFFVRIRHTEGSEIYQMEVGDNGKGMQSDAAERSKKSLGSQLIQRLARQLQGKIVLESGEEGTVYKLEFKEVGKKS